MHCWLAELKKKSGKPLDFKEAQDALIIPIL